MKCLLIVQENGILSALPTVQEADGFAQQDMFTFVVEVSERVRALVFQERSRIRVFAPGVPMAQKRKRSLYQRLFKRKELNDFSHRSDWLFVAVIGGRLVLA